MRLPLAAGVRVKSESSAARGAVTGTARVKRREDLGGNRKFAYPRVDSARPSSRLGQ